MTKPTVIHRKPFLLIAPDYREDFPFRVHTVGYHHSAREGTYHQSRLDRYFCGVLLKGHSSFVVDNRTPFDATQGDMYILHKGESFKVSFDLRPRNTALYVSADGALFEALLEAYGLRGVHVIPGLNCRTEIEAILRLAKEGDGDLHRKAAVLTHTIFRKMAAKLGEVDIRTYSPDVQRIKSFLDSHVESMIRIQVLCDLVSRSPAHVNRMFKREVGLAPYEYHLNRKIELARHLLGYPGLYVKEVAARLSFADPYYFSGLFKQKTGLSPSVYRHRRLAKDTAAVAGGGALETPGEGDLPAQLRLAPAIRPKATRQGSASSKLPSACSKRSTRVPGGS